MKKILLFLITLIMPVLVFADSGANYQDTVHYVNNYIHSFKKYNSYLFFKDKTEYVYEDGVYSYSPDFNSGGLLSRTEYEISNRKNNTYLSNGLEYWTLTKSSGGRHFVLNYRLLEKLDTLNSGIRVTEYVKNNSAVTGKGSYADPWVFSEVLNMHLNSTNIIRGKVSLVPCSNTSMQKETVTLSFTSGSSATAYICPASGYTVYTNSCSGYMTRDLNNKYIVSGVSKDNLICNITFTYSTNQVTLGCNNCNTNPNPNQLYINSVHDLWFTKREGLDSDRITQLNTIPAKTGYTFKGFHKNGTLVIDTAGVFMENATSIIGSGNVNATMEANVYTVNFNTPSPTSTNHTTTAQITYDSTPAEIIPPVREYTVSYNANGGTVARAQDIIRHTFTGYFYDSVKYFDGNGNAARTWNIPQNTTLTGVWSGGTISLPSASRPGYRLVGWYTSNNTKIEDGTVITQNMSLTAKWEAVSVNYTVKHYKENIDGSYANPETETLSAITATTVTPAVKTYTGFNSPSVQSAVVDGSGNTVIEYRYTRKKYTVSISRNNTNFGTVNKTSLTIKHGTTYSSSGNTLTFVDGQSVSATITDVTGYTTTFSSWSPESGTITGATTITANFARTPIMYTYTFTSNNDSYGSISPTTLSVPYDATYTVSSNVLTFSTGQKVTASPTAKTGYTTTFSSWSSNSGTVSGAATITANFARTPNKYSVIYNCNGGTPTSAYSSEHTYDSAKNLTENRCTRDGFSFAGWNAAANGSGTNYSDEQSVKNLKSSNNDTINLYAKWNDISAPSCKLKATSNGVTFDTKTDNVAVTEFGLIKSTTATYNSKTTLEFSNGTFYGYVKDAAGNTNKCSITIGGTYVSSYTKTTNKCNKNVASYDKTTQTCKANFKNYTKTTKTCNATFNFTYSKTTETCDVSVTEYKKVSKTCTKKTVWAKTTKKCGITGYTGTCKCKNTTYGAATNVPCGSNSTCAAACGYSMIADGTCTATYGWDSGSTEKDLTSCSSSSSSCTSSSHSGNKKVTCQSSLKYDFASATTTYPSTCKANTIVCDASTYGTANVECTANKHSYSWGSTKNSVETSCSPASPSCSSPSHSGNKKVTCTKNYDYDFGSETTDTVSSCNNNKISCSSSTSGQTYTSCNANYSYDMSSSTSKGVSSCTPESSFTCKASNKDKSYVSNCSENYSYDFSTSSTSVTSCTSETSFTCGSGTVGDTYVTCTPAEYECSNSGYTKVTNNYCYKY